MPRTVNRTGRARKTSGNINVAPGGSTTRFRRRNKIGEQFAARTVAMLRSPAYRVLSLTGHRILARLEIELAAHAGRENGFLPCTFDDFEQYGIQRHSIAPAIRETVALGFHEITQYGRAGNREFRRPHLFRITYKPTDNAPQSDEWDRIKSIEEAEAIALKARKPIKRPRKQKQKTSDGKCTITRWRKMHYKTRFS
jgi:hypothetical protein